MTTYEPVLQRILDKLQEKGFTGKELELHLKLSNGSVTKWRIRNGKSYFRHIMEIADFLGTTAAYLLTGNIENPDDLTEDEKEIINMYRNTTQDRQNLVRNILREFSSEKCEQKQ